MMLEELEKRRQRHRPRVRLVPKHARPRRHRPSTPSTTWSGCFDGGLPGSGGPSALMAAIRHAPLSPCCWRCRKKRGNRSRLAQGARPRSIRSVASSANGWITGSLEAMSPRLWDLVNFLRGDRFSAGPLMSAGRGATWHGAGASEAQETGLHTGPPPSPICACFEGRGAGTIPALADRIEGRAGGRCRPVFATIAKLRAMRPAFGARVLGRQRHAAAGRFLVPYGKPPGGMMDAARPPG